MEKGRILSGTEKEVISGFLYVSAIEEEESSETLRKMDDFLFAKNITTADLQEYLERNAEEIDKAFYVTIQHGIENILNERMFVEDLPQFVPLTAATATA